MKKVLLVTDVNFWQKCSGNRTRIHTLILWLSNHFQLTVVNTGPAPANIEVELQNEFKADFHVLEKLKYLTSNGYGRRLRAFLKSKHFDAVIIEYIHSSYFLNFLIEDATVILDAHDIISERADEFKIFNHKGALYEISAEDEAEIFNVYDYVIALCAPDYEKISAIVPAGKALLCPHPVIPMPRLLHKGVKIIAFIASSYLPNVDAIIFFINNCWPRIAARHPVQLHLYGTICNAIDIGEDDRIKKNGFVADSRRIYAEADIIINPVRFGAGLKIKNMEALANGIPLVTTNHGARGLEELINKGFLVADSPEDFIGAVSLLIDNYRVRCELSSNALVFMEQNFNEQACFKPLLEAIG